jgi:hypothetical protein
VALGVNAPRNHHSGQKVTVEARWIGQLQRRSQVVLTKQEREAEVNKIQKHLK